MPYSLTEQQIEYILNDIQDRGIEIEKLQINLLDHICCLIEENMNEGDDFESFYQETVKKFYENKLNELEKETRGLLIFKHYYIIKNILYIILVASISYNIYGVAKYANDCLTIRNYSRETSRLKNITLKEGYDELLQRLKKEYPHLIKKDFICVNFLSHPMSDYEKEMFGYDVLDTIPRRNGDDKIYRDIDSLAGIYFKNVTYIVAFQQTDKITDSTILKRKAIMKNVIFLNGMNKLLSGYENQKKSNVAVWPTIFIFNKKGEIIYDRSLIIRANDLANFLKTKSN